MLDLAVIASQIRTFTQDQTAAQPLVQDALRVARARLEATKTRHTELQVRIIGSRTSWLVARLREEPCLVISAPGVPDVHTVYASDSSQIVTDRHEIALCYLLNVGLITLHYSPDAHAVLTSRPILAHPDESLLDDFPQETAAISPRRLGLRRQLSEYEALAELAETQDAEIPAVALFDGSLILWQLDTESPEFRSDTLNALTAYWEAFRECRVPIVGYISLPGSRDVLNALRVSACPHPQSRCESYCPDSVKRHADYVPPPCAGTERITDEELFALMLKPGERSAVFESAAKILEAYSETQKIDFYYLHTGFEIARVEIPRWVADDPELLNRTHALCLDQAYKGNGYPVALAEAHEQAMIRGPERDVFFYLMECRMAEFGLPVRTTRKALSKRARRV